MDGMIAHLSIGDFSRATRLTVKTLHHYHRIGLLEPADIDPFTGYRRYSTDQLPTAQVIRRFRDLGMPLEEIQAVLTAPDVRTRDERIASHLRRLENELSRTQSAVASLRDLLSAPQAGQDARITLRSVPETKAAAVSAVVDGEEAVAWFQGALGELRATLDAQGVAATGPAGGVFADDLFTHHRGRATIFVPCDEPIRATGRVEAGVIPAAELAIVEHVGPSSEVDRSYAALATHVARHAIAVDGPIREYYVVGRQETSDASEWRTEIGWPVFRTGADGSAA